MYCIADYKDSLSMQMSDACFIDPDVFDSHPCIFFLHTIYLIHIIFLYFYIQPDKQILYEFNKVLIKNNSTLRLRRGY